MGNFFKLFLKGIVATILLPLILAIWLLYGVYCLGLFLVMFVKGVIEFFQGKEPAGEMIEDIESRRTILEKEEADAHAREMVNLMYQNAMVQQQMNAAAVAPQVPPTPVQPYGPNVFNQQPSLSEEIPSFEAPTPGQMPEGAPTEDVNIDEEPKDGTDIG